MVLEMPAALGAVSWVLSMFGGGWRGGVGASWKVCECLEVQFLFPTWVWRLCPTVLIQGSQSWALLLSSISWTLVPCHSQKEKCSQGTIAHQESQGWLCEDAVCILL